MSVVNSPTSPTSKVNSSIGQLQQPVIGTNQNQTAGSTSPIVKHLLKTFGDLKLDVGAGAGSASESMDLTSEQFDVKQFTAAIGKTSQLGEHLTSLTQSLHALDAEIREQVSAHHEDLLHQAVNIETLDEMLDMIQTRVAALKSTSERLRAKIGTPYAELSLRVLQLSRLQAACDTLRRIKGVLFYSGKLRAHMHVGVKDLVKSAQALNELDFLLKNFDDAAEIGVIADDVHFAHKARREVEEQAQVILEKGMQHQDQTKIGTALQVFYSLGVLSQKLIECLKSSEKSFQKTCHDLLDTTNLTLQSTSSSSSSASLHTSVSSAAVLSSSSLTSSSHQFPGRSTMPSLGSMGQFRAQLWTNIEKLMDTMYDACAQILQLQIILEKKKDLVTNLLYLDEIDFAALFTQKMYVANFNTATVNSTDASDAVVTPSVLVYESICALLTNPIDMSSKKSIEFLYEQWRAFTSVLNGAFVSACSQSNYIKETFQNEYPKLLKLTNELWLRLLQLTPMIDRYRYTTLSAATSASTASSRTAATNSSQLSIVDQIKSGSTSSSSSSSSSFVTAYDLLRKCFQDLENAYLNRSLSHLFDPINLIFSNAADKPINRNDIDTYIKGIQTQLQTVQYDIFNNSAASLALLGGTTNRSAITTTTTSVSSSSSSFSDKVVASLCKSIQMYANKCEQLLNTLNADMQQALANMQAGGGSTLSSNQQSAGISSSNVFYYSSGAQPYSIQMRTLEFVNQTHELYETLTRLFAAQETLNRRQEERLAAALKSLVVFEENSLGVYIHSAADCILAIMLTMHQEDFSSSIANSLYMRELSQVMQRIVQNYLQQFACKSILSQYLIQLSTRCIDLFTRHASLLRPISDAHRHRLVNDAQQLESIIQTSLGTRLIDLGVHYKHLKAFRAMLKIAPADLLEPESNALNNVFESESLPHHLALHYLFGFGPNELKSPHQSLDWPLVKYSDWLDKHTNEKERLMVIKTCLETYVSVVRQKKEKKFAPVYPIMLRILEKALQSATTNNTTT